MGRFLFLVNIETYSLDLIGLFVKALGFMTHYFLLTCGLRMSTQLLVFTFVAKLTKIHSMPCEDVIQVLRSNKTSTNLKEDVRRISGELLYMSSHLRTGCLSSRATFPPSWQPAETRLARDHPPVLGPPTHCGCR